MQLLASPAASTTACPAGFTCYTDGPRFAKALGDSSGGPSAPPSAKLALLCPAVHRCNISGTQLGFIDGVAATVLMENVVLGPNDAEGEDGAVLNIGTGSVTGTGLLFQGGQNSEFGGCVKARVLLSSVLTAVLRRGVGPVVAVNAPGGALFLVLVYAAPCR